MSTPAAGPGGRPVVDVPDRAAWRAWLEAHHAQPDGVWVLMRKQATGDAGRLRYDESVEEALCFGWVDSRAGKLDATRYLQFFSPRREGGWSRPNKERVARLRAAGRMAPAGLAAIEAAEADGSWTALDDVEELVEPDELAAALDAEPRARAEWDAFPRSAKRGILEWIASAKRPRPAPAAWPRPPSWPPRACAPISGRARPTRANA